MESCAAKQQTALERRISALENGVTKTKDLKHITSKNKNLEEVKTEDISLNENKVETIQNNQTISGDIKPLAEWGEILHILRKDCPLIWGVLNDSSAYIKGSYLLIDAPNSQFRTMINSDNAQYKDSIKKAAFSVLGENFKLGPYAKQANETEIDPLKQIANKLKNFEI